MQKSKKILTWVRNNLKHGSNNMKRLFRLFYSQQHQLTSTTSGNRYPELFFATVNAFGQNKKPHILSFGCSTGEECFTLKSYFPDAIITGVDINNRNLKKAKTANKSEEISFLYSSPENIVAKGPYDMIFCLSVLCRWEDTKNLTNCEKIYPFNKYETTVEMLCKNLKRGGLLIIYNSNFRFEDSSCFKEFEVIKTSSIVDSGFVNKFNANNEAIYETHRACIYQKR